MPVYARFVRCARRQRGGRSGRHRTTIWLRPHPSTKTGHGQYQYSEWFLVPGRSYDMNTAYGLEFGAGLKQGKKGTASRIPGCHPCLPCRGSSRVSQRKLMRHRIRKDSLSVPCSLSLTFSLPCNPPFPLPFVSQGKIR